MLYGVTVEDERTLHNLWMLQMVQYDKILAYSVYNSSKRLVEIHDIVVCIIVRQVVVEKHDA
jgi:hypothetical protein